MVTLVFKYDIGTEVKVIPIGMMGRVDAASVDFKGIQYRVVYWNDGSRHSEWVYEWEIES